MKAVYGKICLFKLIKNDFQSDRDIEMNMDVVNRHNLHQKSLWGCKNDKLWTERTKHTCNKTQKNKRNTMWKLAFHLGSDIKTVLECGSDYSGLHQTLVPQGKCIQVVWCLLEGRRGTKRDAGLKRGTLFLWRVWDKVENETWVSC